MKISNILISQPEQTIEKTPYQDLVDKYGVAIKFRQFIKVEGLSVNDFRKQGVNVLDHTSVVFNSKLGVDHYFCTHKKMRVDLPLSIKYFCISEMIANYIQKYVEYRRRTFIFPEGGKTAANENFVKLILANSTREDRFMLVLSADNHSPLPELMKKAKCDYSKAYMYRTVTNNVSDVNIADYQLVAFFSPFGIASLFENFPTFEQKDTVIAAMGSGTAKAVAARGLRLDIAVPTREAQSMPDAIGLYLSNLFMQGQ